MDGNSFALRQAENRKTSQSTSYCIKTSIIDCNTGFSAQVCSSLLLCDELSKGMPCMHHEAWVAACRHYKACRYTCGAWQTADVLHKPVDASPNLLNCSFVFTLQFKILQQLCLSIPSDNCSSGFMHSWTI